MRANTKFRGYSDYLHKMYNHSQMIPMSNRKGQPKTDIEKIFHEKKEKYFREQKMAPYYKSSSTEGTTTNYLKLVMQK